MGVLCKIKQFSSLSLSSMLTLASRHKYSETELENIHFQEIANVPARKKNDLTSDNICSCQEWKSKS